MKSQIHTEIEKGYRVIEKRIMVEVRGACNREKKTAQTEKTDQFLRLVSNCIE